MALQFPPPENPSAAGDKDQNGSRFLRQVTASPYVEQLAFVLAVADR